LQVAPRTTLGSTSSSPTGGRSSSSAKRRREPCRAAMLRAIVFTDGFFDALFAWCALRSRPRAHHSDVDSGKRLLSARLRRWLCLLRRCQRGRRRCTAHVALGALLALRGGCWVP